MNSKKALIIPVLFALLLSCGPFSIVPADNGGNNNSSNGDIQQQIDQALAATHLVETQVALSIQQTMAAQNANQPPPTLTLTVSTKVMVSVSTATYCRSGPGDAYPLVGTLYVGQSAEAIARSSYGDTLIIKLPEMTSTTCWLWLGYATVTGNKDSLPVMSAPPVPATLTPSNIQLCLNNNSGGNILYVYIRHPGDGWGVDQLGADTLNVGETFCWTKNPGNYDVRTELSGHVEYKSWYNVSMMSNTTLVIPP